jgi:hypothetical protein
MAKQILNFLVKSRKFLKVASIRVREQIDSMPTPARPQGPLRRPQANREIRPQGKHDEVERAVQRRLPEARCT